MNPNLHPATPAITRRSLLKHSSVGAFALMLPGSVTPNAAQAADAKTTGNRPVTTLNRFPRMVHEEYVRRLRAIARRASERRASIHSPDDAIAYVREVRRKIADSFGLWPERTPLNPKTAGIVERDRYTVEKVIFESRPDFPVTANLYLPRERAGKIPGVVGSCGHLRPAKAAAEYQSYAQGLVHQGYAVLIFDPIGQGEREQYLTPDLKPKFPVMPTWSEHAYIGNQQFLVGEFFGSWRAWDGIRALDYLLSRPEVDPGRVGVTGHSGGGTMTAWLCGLDDRWHMAAPSCFITTFLRNFENELPADTEQCPPRLLAMGLDHADFIAALAPKPVILLGQEKDVFDARGLEEAFRSLQSLYTALGSPANISLMFDDGYHGYSPAHRSAMYGWFNHATGVLAPTMVPEPKLEKEETLWCTKEGQVAAASPRTVFSFTADSSRALARSRRMPSGVSLPALIERELRLSPSSSVPEYRILRPLVDRNYPRPHAAVYAVETEPNIFALVYRLSDTPLLSRPPKIGGPAILYVSHVSADDELRTEPLISDLIKAEPDAAFFTCDVRGIGESRTNALTREGIDSSGTEYFHAIHGMMLDWPTIGQRTHDLLAVVAWLAANGHSSIHVAAKGWGTLPATFASILSSSVNRVTLKNAPRSYSVMAEEEHYGWPVSLYTPGILRHFDLPDCYRALTAKTLRQIEPRGAIASLA